MQDKRKRKSRSSKRIRAKTLIVFICVALVAYLPVSSFLFALKNDAFSGYFPPRYFISEALHSNSFPWWNPYINYGLPQYGDMNSGFYSPLTWLIALLFGYNPYTFTLELMFYLVLAGMGMFRYCRTLDYSRAACYIAGLSYLGCGYLVGHLQHFNWVAAAALLPWCMLAYHRLIHQFSLKNSVFCSLLFYLFAASAHPGLIIGGLYFFAAYIVYQFLEKKSRDKVAFSARSFGKKNLWMFGLLLLLSAGLIIGYTDIIPYMTRGERLRDLSLMVNPFTPQSLISLVLPMAAMKGDLIFRTDLSMRNAYIGLTLLVFLIPELRYRQSLYRRFLIITGLFFFILSLGGPFRYLTYLLPLTGYVRLSGEFMLFPILCAILLAADGLNRYTLGENDVNSRHILTLKIMRWITLGAMTAGLCGMLLSGQTFFRHVHDIIEQPGLAPLLKTLIDRISFFDLLLFQGLIQFVLLGYTRQFILKKQFNYLIQLVMVEITLITLLNVPFTGVGQSSVRDVVNSLNRMPEGIKTPYLTPIADLDRVDVTRYQSRLLGSSSFYNKNIGTSTKAFYPVELKTSSQLFEGDSSRYHHLPLVFSEKGKLEQVEILGFGPDYMDLIVTCSEKDKLVYQQNLYPRWTCMLNGQVVKNSGYQGVFNALDVPAGKQYVKFLFFPGLVGKTFGFSKYVLLLAVVYLIIVWFKRTFLS